VLGLAFVGSVAWLAGGREPETPADPIAKRARAFLDALAPGPRKRASAPFADPGREDWHYVPRRRRGVSLGELGERQRAALEALLKAALSDAGHEKAKGVVTLEGVLVELGADPEFRDPGLYFVRVFGEPGGDEPWGFSFEGHHLSLNYTSPDGARYAGTPAFFGANPHRVPRGRHEGLRVLGEEEDRARKLLASLTEKQRERAVLAGRAPWEIVTGARSRARLEQRRGLPAKAMNEEQRKQLRALVELYARNHEPAVADPFLKRVEEAGFGAVHFSWAGPVEPGRPHYYRVHGPTFVIEYVNAQNGANHSHTVLRDFENDFGRDWLKEHLERGHGHD